MQQISRYFPFPPLLILASLLLVLTFASPTATRAESGQSVTIGVGATTLTIEGQTSPDTFVTILQDSAVIGSTSAASDGRFSLTLSFETGGIKQLTLVGRTPANYMTDPLTATINVTDHQNTLYYAFLPPTINLDVSETTIDKSITASGETMPDGAITITIDTGSIVQTNADTLGKWSVTIQASSPGPHTLFAVTYDDRGRQSAPTRRLSFIITENKAAQAPPAPISPVGPSPIILPKTPIIASPQDNQYLNGRAVTIRGSAERGSLVEIWEGDQIIGSTYASSDGTWHISFSLTAPHSVLRARTCRFGTCSDFSPPVNIYFSPSPLAGSLYTALSTESYNLSAPIGKQVSVELLIEKGAAPYAVTVDWGDHTNDNKTYAHTGRFTLFHTYLSPGHYNGTVRVVDSNKVEDIHRFAVRIQELPLSSRLGHITILTGLAVIVLVIFGLFTPYLVARLKRKR